MHPDKLARKAFKQKVKILATSLAMLHYNHNHPGVDDEQAEAYARGPRTWSSSTSRQAGRPARSTP
jgi:hypothetical protein